METKICHIMDHMGLGGAQTIVRDLVTRNTNHYLFSLRETTTQLKFDKKVPKNRIYFSKQKSKYSLRVYSELKEFIIKNNIEILHVHLKKSVLVTYLLKKLNSDMNLKLVFHEHAAIKTDKKTYPLFIKYIAKNFDRFIAVSKECRELLISKSNLDPKKVDVVYNYAFFENKKLLTSTQKIQLRKELGFTKSDYLVGFAGRMLKYKGVETIIKSQSLLKDKTIKIVLIGDGPDINYFKKAATNVSNISFLGFRSDMEKLYQILDVLVLPSTKEGNPMTFFESQYYKVPFIGSDITSIKEVVIHDKNGLLFELWNEKDLAKNILYLKNNPENTKKIIKNGHALLKKFNIQTFEKELSEVYKKLK